jgi:phage-related protein
LSNVITFYKVQMLTASATTNVFTGALVRLRAALYAVWTALGPIGWAIIALSVAVGAGMNIWNKYKSALQQAKMQGSLAAIEEQTKKLGQSSEDAAAGTDDLTDATKKASKAAGKNLQSFDEVHQLQEDMAGSAEDLAENMGLDAAGVEGIEDMFDVSGIDIPDLSDIQVSWKEILSAIWQDISNWVDGVKQKFGEFIGYVKSWAIWDWMGRKWNDIKNVASTSWSGIVNVISTAWSGIVNVTKTTWQEVSNLLQTYWNNAVKLVTDVFGAIWGFIKGTWDNIRNTTFSIWGAIWSFLMNQWETIKVFGINIFGTVRDLILGKIDLRTAVKQIWGEIKSFFFNSWTNIRDFGINIWDTLLNFFLNQWLLIQGFAIAIWTAIKDFFAGNWEATKEAATSIWTAIKDFFAGNWEATKEAATSIWTAIKDFFSQTWEAIKTAATNIWTAILDFLGINWGETKKRASEIWGNVKTIITDKWNELKNAVGPTWNGIKTAIADKWQEIKDDAFSWGKNLISSFVGGIKDRFNSVKSTLKSVGETVKDFLGFSSPTKEGPGRFADEWAPNLMNMFAEGLNQNIPKVRSAVDEVAQQLTGMTVQPTVQQSIVPATTTTGDSGLADTVAQAVYQAIMDAIRIAQASSQQSDDRELVLKIDNTVLARMQLPAIIREGQRQGLNLVVQPQGV